MLGGLDDVGMAVAQAGHRRPARCVDIRLAVLIEQAYAFAPHGKGQLLLGVAMKYVCHGARL